MVTGCGRLELRGDKGGGPSIVEEPHLSGSLGSPGAGKRGARILSRAPIPSPPPTCMQQRPVIAA